MVLPFTSSCLPLHSILQPSWPCPGVAMFPVFLLSTSIPVLTCSFSSCVRTLPFPQSLLLSLRCSLYRARPVFILCRALAPLIFQSCTEVLLLLMWISFSILMHCSFPVLLVLSSLFPVHTCSLSRRCRASSFRSPVVLLLLRRDSFFY